MNLLHLDSSILGDQSASRALTAEIVARYVDNVTATAVIYRDLAANPPPHLTAAALGARGAAGGTSLEDQARENALTDALIAELIAADVLVIGAPMYNFTIPTPLKAWLDRVAQAGRTFRYTAQGPEGLVTGKKVIVVSTRGGVHGERGTGRSMDFQEPYLLAMLGFLGMTDVEVIRAEGLGLGAEPRQAALAAARRAIDARFLRRAA